MTNEHLTEIKCPNCQAPIDVREHGKHVQCSACNSQFLLQGRLCPNCHSYHAEDVAICGDCGSALNRVCRKCRHPNWAGDEYCVQCGTIMDFLDVAFQTHRHATTNRLQQQMDFAKQIKAQEAEAAKQRMDKFMEMEKERLAQLQMQKMAQKKRDQQLLIGIGLIIFLFILAIGAFLVITAG